MQRGLVCKCKVCDIFVVQLAYGTSNVPSAVQKIFTGLIYKAEATGRSAVYASLQSCTCIIYRHLAY